MNLLDAATDALAALLSAASIGATVYEYVPQAPTYPYCNVRSGVETRAAIMGRSGRSVLLQAHVFTSSESYAGSGQARAIASAIEAATEYAALAITDWDLTYCRTEQVFDAGAETVNGVTYEHYVAMVRIEALPS